MTAAYIARPEVFAVAAFKSVMLSVRRGNSPLAAQADLSYGIILCGVTGDIATGYKFGELALNLLDSFDARSLRPRALFLFNGFIAHWRNHYRETFAPLREAYQLGLESGDFNFAGLAAFDYTFQAYWAGEDLASLERELVGYADVFRTLNQEIIVGLLTMYRQAILNLTEGRRQPGLCRSGVLRRGSGCSGVGGNPQRQRSMPPHPHKMILAYLFRRYEDAARHSIKVRQYLEGLTATQEGVPIFHYYSALIHLGLAGSGFARREDSSHRPGKS